MKEILQKSIPYPVVWDAALPGVLPLRDDCWIIEDEAFAKQMAERDRLVQGFPGLCQSKLALGGQGYFANWSNDKIHPFYYLKSGPRFLNHLVKI